MSSKFTENIEERKPVSSGKAVRRMGDRYLKWTAYGIVLLIISIVQTIPHGIPEIFGVRPAPIAVAAVCIAMFEGPIGGAAAGIAAGVLWDLYSPRPMGFNSLWLMIMCCACGLLSQMLVRNNLPSTMMVTSVVLIIQGLVNWFFNGVLAFKPDLMEILLRNALSAAYTFLISPVVYLIILLVSRILRRRE